MRGYFDISVFKILKVDYITSTIAIIQYTDRIQREPKMITPLILYHYGMGNSVGTDWTARKMTLIRVYTFFSGSLLSILRTGALVTH